MATEMELEARTAVRQRMQLGPSTPSLQLMLDVLFYNNKYDDVVNIQPAS